MRDLKTQEDHNLNGAGTRSTNRTNNTDTQNNGTKNCGKTKNCKNQTNKDCK